MENTTSSPAAPLYEQLAEEIEGQVTRGTFRTGERVPSVRQVSQQKNLSVTTVLRAYQLLEDRGVIEARPQSGYYVRMPLAAAIPEPEISTPSFDPSQVNVTDLVMQVLHSSMDQHLVQFGAAIPDPKLLPTARLNRTLIYLARHVEIPQNMCGEPRGLEELRVQAAQRAFYAGYAANPDEMIITSGATEAMNLALRAICQPGDLVAIESPTYFGVLHILESLGLRTLEIPTHARTGVSLGALRFALDHHPVRACLFVTNFNNPLGSLMPSENKHELVQILAEREIPLIEDDINGELCFNGQRPEVAKAYDRNGLVLLCSSFSKTISPSYRVGWIAPGRYRAQVERLKLATNLCTSILPQMAIAEFLKSGGFDHYLRRMRRAYAQKVAMMVQAVGRYFPQGTRVTKPQGGHVVWVQLPEQVDSLALYGMALKVGITLAPGYIFSPTTKYRNFIRLNVAYMDENAERAVMRLGELAGRLAGS
jgi:DNA-binding transcriptional MocR family regulator